MPGVTGSRAVPTAWCGIPAQPQGPRGAKLSRDALEEPGLLWSSWLICLLRGGSRRECWAKQVTSAALATIALAQQGTELFCWLQGKYFRTK